MRHGTRANEARRQRQLQMQGAGTLQGQTARRSIHTRVTISQQEGRSTCDAHTALVYCTKHTLLERQRSFDSRYSKESDCCPLRRCQHQESVPWMSLYATYGRPPPFPGSCVSIRYPLLARQSVSRKGRFPIQYLHLGPITPPPSIVVSGWYGIRGACVWE